MLKLGTLGAVVLTLAATPFAAQANASPIDSKTIVKAKRVAVAYWNKRGRRVCRPLRVTNVPLGRFTAQSGNPNALGAAAFGPVASGSVFCRVLLNKAHNWRTKAKAHGWSRGQMVCAVVVHEVGHTTGLAHRRTGIMQGALRLLPKECKKAFKGLPAPPSPPPPDYSADDDGDGVPNVGRPGYSRSDVCPDEPGNASDGCFYAPEVPSDYDQDGVPDNDDACPAVAGPPPSGCPGPVDSDDDSIPE